MRPQGPRAERTPPLTKRRGGSPRRGVDSSLGYAFRPSVVVAGASRADTAWVVEVSTPEPRVPRRPYLRWLPLVALGLFALLPPPSLTVIPDAPAIPATHIEALEHELMLAIQARDRRRLDDLIAADCNLTGSESGGARLGKRAYLAAALDPEQLTIEDYHFVDLAATVVATDVAIVRATLDRRGWLRGQKTAGRLLLTDVWRRRVGRWQLVNRHASAPPADLPQLVTDRQ